MTSTMSMLFLAGMLSTAPSKVPAAPCEVPRALSGPMRDLRPPPGSEMASINRLAICLKQQRVNARRYPLTTVDSREAANRAMGAIVTWGKQALRRVPYGQLAHFVDVKLQSPLYTDEVKAGIGDKFGAFRVVHERSMRGLARDPQAAREVISAWNELRAEFQKIHDSPNALPAEKALVADQIRAGDLLTDYMVFDALEASKNLTAEQLRSVLTAMGIQNDQLASRVEESLAEMTALVEKAAAGDRTVDGAATAQRIGEYAALSQSLIGVASRTGLMTPNDATVLTQLVSGVSQISAAAALLSDPKSAVFAAGPYGMAIGGALILADALQRPQPSEGQQIMRMLAQISRQITHLQATVEAGFAGTREQINQSEMRVMGRLSDILTANHHTLARVDLLRTDLEHFRQEMLQVRKNESAALNEAFVKQAAYDDERCLRRFNTVQFVVRRRCMESYAALVREFTTVHNARLIGERAAPLDPDAGVDEQAAALAVEYARLADSAASLSPVHKPALDLISHRVRTFIGLNPSLLNDSDARELMGRIDAFEEAHRGYVAAFTAPGFVSKLEREYTAELHRILQGLDQRASVFADTVVRTVSDEVHEREIQRLHEPTSMRAMSAAFQGSNIIASRISGVRDNLDHLVLRDSSLRLQAASRSLVQKLDNYALAAARKDPVASAVFPERLDGHLWVGPCNAESGYPVIAMARHRAAGLLPAKVVALSGASRTVLSVCYSPAAERSSEMLSNHNSNSYMDVVLARLATQGFQASGFGYIAMCAGLPGYFAQHYGSNREYFSAWEKCHKGHFHHEVRSNAELLRSITFVASFQFPGYRTPLKTFARSIGSDVGALEACILPFDRTGQQNRSAVLMPFRHTYPLPVTTACPAVDDRLEAALSAMRVEMETFLAESKTRLEAVPGSPEITYGQALNAILTDAAEQNYRAFLSAVFGDASSTERFDRLHVLLSAVSHLRGPQAGDAPGLSRMSAADLREYIALMLRDRDRQEIRSAVGLWAAPAAQ